MVHLSQLWLRGFRRAKVLSCVPACVWIASQTACLRSTARFLQQKNSNKQQGSLSLFICAVQAGRSSKGYMPYIARQQIFACCLGQFRSIFTMTRKYHSILSPGQTENSNVFLKSCGIFQWEDIAGFMLPVNHVSLGENFSRLNSCLGWSNKLIMGVVYHHTTQGHTPS